MRGDGKQYIRQVFEEIIIEENETLPSFFTVFQAVHTVTLLFQS